MRHKKSVVMEYLLTLFGTGYGGVLTGAGIGMVFLGQATTGGTDLVAAVLQHFFRQYSIAKLMQVAADCIE